MSCLAAGDRSVDHPQYPVIALRDAAERMHERRVRAIGFRSLGLTQNAHYPGSLDFALGNDIARVVAQLIAGDLTAL
jgi:hypothetical protein